MLIERSIAKGITTYTTSSLQTEVIVNMTHIRQPLKCGLLRGSPPSTYHVYKLAWQST